jgi:hypothetical protein
MGIAAQSSMILSAGLEDIGAVATFKFWLNFKNLWQADPSKPEYNKIKTLVKYVDGYEYLQLQRY